MPKQTLALLNDVPKRFALLQLKEVLVVLGLALVVEPQIRGTVLTQQQLLRRADLIEELGEHLVVREGLRDFVALDGLVAIAAECKHLLHTRVVLFQHFDGQLSVVDRAHASLDKFALERVLVLLDHLVRELHGLVVGALNLVPDEALHVLAAALDIFEDVVHGLAGARGLLARLVDQRGELLEFTPVQQVNIHQINEGAAVLKLFLRFVELLVQTLKRLVAESLSYGLHKGVEGERETRSKFV